MENANKKKSHSIQLYCCAVKCCEQIEVIIFLSRPQKKKPKMPRSIFSFRYDKKRERMNAAWNGKLLLLNYCALIS